MGRVDPFRIRLRVQLAGVVSLLAIPLVLAAAVVALFLVNVRLALGILLVFAAAGLVALDRVWTLTRPRPVSAAEAPELHALVDRLCVQGDLVKPMIVLHQVAWANSWVKGLSSRRSTLHVTSGLLDRLDGSQLEAVMAHELAHVGQRDSTLMSAVGAPVEILLAGASFYFHALGWSSSPRESDARFDRSAGGLVLLLTPIGLGFSLLGQACRVIAAWFSRVRELEADAGAARLTGNPAGLASALIALSQDEHPIPSLDLRRASALDVFHIVALRHETWFARTHPSLKQRLAQLDQIEHRVQSRKAS